MGKIVIKGIDVDTEDIDLLIRHKPLAELDALVKADEEVTDRDSYWQHRIDTHRVARDISEWCFMNGMKVIDLPRHERDRTQGLYALEKAREIEARQSELEQEFKGFVAYMLSKKKEELFE